jgi:Na+/melibiose symporter-like transporter
LKRIVNTQAATAALLAGQICDGIATPIVGYISDRYNTRWGNYISYNRAKNSMVYIWINFGFYLLHTNLSKF